MTALKDILLAVREEHLSKAMLEQYEQQLAALFADMQMAIGEGKKERALFFLERQRPEVSDISIRRLFDATPIGQTLIENEHNVKAVGTMIRSVRSRIFQTY